MALQGYSTAVIIPSGTSTSAQNWPTLRGPGGDSLVAASCSCVPSQPSPQTHSLRHRKESGDICPGKPDRGQRQRPWRAWRSAPSQGGDHEPKPSEGKGDGEGVGMGETEAEGLLLGLLWNPSNCQSLEAAKATGHRSHWGQVSPRARQDQLAAFVGMIPRPHQPHTGQSVGTGTVTNARAAGQVPWGRSPGPSLCQARPHL